MIMQNGGGGGAGGVTIKQIGEISAASAGESSFEGELVVPTGYTLSLFAPIFGEVFMTGSLNKQAYFILGPAFGVFSATNNSDAYYPLGVDDSGYPLYFSIRGHVLYDIVTVFFYRLVNGKMQEYSIPTGVSISCGFWMIDGMKVEAAE